MLLFVVYSFTAPQNHSEAEDVYDFALKVEQGHFADQAGVNRVLALPALGVAYRAAQLLGYDGRAFPFMIIINRFLAVVCVFLFYHLLTLAYRRHPAFPGSASLSPNTFPNHQPSTSNQQLVTALLLAFSYGFWRYANEAETYILASVLVLGAWCLAIGQQSAISDRQSAKDNGSPTSSLPPERRLLRAGGRPWFTLLCPLVSAFGILVHLLNLVPLLLIIPLYYLFSGKWKNAVFHGLMTGGLVGLGYGLCFHMLDWGNLGAHDQPLEAGFSLSNVLRGGIASGQCLVSGNFLFGFESFRDALINLFPSRMLGEEFYMASHMPDWIKWAGCVTITAFSVCSLWFAFKCWQSQKACWSSSEMQSSANFKTKNSNIRPLTISSAIWLLLYALAVIHTEAGSPELWIMALIPFWLIVAPLQQRAWGMGHGGSTIAMDRTGRICSWGLVLALFLHNLVAGLLPVMSNASDYHVAKGKWLVEHCGPQDLILTDYEPVMVFYLDYYVAGDVVSSGAMNAPDIERKLGTRTGNAYALASFFRPMESMRVRNPKQYARMVATGEALQSGFVKIEDDEFGGVWEFKEQLNIDK